MWIDCRVKKKEKEKNRWRLQPAIMLDVSLALSNSLYPRFYRTSLRSSWTFFFFVFLLPFYRLRFCRSPFYFPPFFCTNRFAVRLAPMAAGPRKLQQPALRHHFFFLLIHSDGNVWNRVTASRAAMNDGAPLSWNMKRRCTLSFFYSEQDANERR